MNKFNKFTFALVLLLSISLSQPNINHQQSMGQQIHDNILKSLIMNQFSDDARPTEEITQVWSNVNNRWENYERYIYEYGAAKSTMNPIPGLIFHHREVWDSQNSVWSRENSWGYTWYNDGTQQSWTQSDANGYPQYMNEYFGPFYNGYATSETYSEYTNGAWAPHSGTHRTFNPYGFPTQTDYTYNNPDTPPSRTVTTYYPTYASSGCPQTHTWWTYTNGGWTPLAQDVSTYGQLPCATDPTPYIIWLHDRCNRNRMDRYSWNSNTSSWALYAYYVNSIDSGTCRTITKTGYGPNGNPTSRYNFYYWGSGGGKLKTNTVYDNSDSRMTRFESELYVNTEWESSQRTWYSYEGIQLDTEDNASNPVLFELDQNYPNPFNPITTIIYELPRESNVRIIIYNSLGNEINTLINEFKPVGQYQVVWDGTDNFGEKVSGGTYFCQLQTGDYSQTRKMLLLK
ncbi:MAG: FlgD immunoglobulin-like domain containing protein [Candidatus Neomarinimicrobiota bacterium]